MTPGNFAASFQLYGIAFCRISRRIIIKKMEIYFSSSQVFKLFMYIYWIERNKKRQDFSVLDIMNFFKMLNFLNHYEKSSHE